MKKELYVICDNIRSLYNVGSIFRTSDALGVKKIYLCGITGTPLQSGCAKVSLGAENSVQWEHVNSTSRLIDRLKKMGCNIVALEQDDRSIDIGAIDRQFPMALIVGNEVDGVASGLLNKCDQIGHNSMNGVKESLNVSVAFGIAGYVLLTV